MRFRPERRVRKRSDFEKAQREGRRVTTPHFVLVLRPSPDAIAGSRLGITATRRVGNAVRRNRLKRLVRAAFRATEAFLPAGFDVVVIVRKDDPSLTLERVVGEWTAERRRIQKVVAQLGGGRSGGTARELPAAHEGASARDVPAARDSRRESSPTGGKC
ncbi:MAG TPA: ribonuclease P protein component [Polyangiaceae bacterium]|nr:ribonuclease P protein component [Polyangiaceae bacterium]